MKKKKRLFIIAAVILAVPLLLLLSIILFAGAGRKIGKPLPKGNIEIPVCRSIHYNSTSQIQKEIIKTWSEGEVSDWVDGEKPDLKNPRTVLGCLLSGKRVEEINQYLLKQNAVGTAGSRWLSASLGHVGNAGHIAVQTAIEDAIKRIVKAGKAAGILTTDAALAKHYMALGATFVAVGLDTQLLIRGTNALVGEFKSTVASSPVVPSTDKTYS